MWPVTEEFRQEIRRSHKSVIRVDVFIAGVRIATVFPNDGSVSVDSRRTVRRTLSMSIVDQDGTLTPGQGAATGLLAPYGAELFVYRGVEYGTGQQELVPIGVFVLTQVTVSEDENGQVITLQGSDRSIRVSRNKFLDPFQITNGTTLEAGLTSLLRDRYIDVQTDFPATGVTLPDVVIEAQSGGDPWAAAVSIAEAFGFDLAFDPDGVARLRVIPDVTIDDPVETYEDGADAVLTTLTRTFDSTRTYNGVIVTSQGSKTDAPFRVIVFDENPNSLTYRFGDFGEVPFFYTSSLITSADQAAVTAAALLRKATGQSEAVEWGQIVNPAHDVLDVIRVRRDTVNLAGLGLRTGAAPLDFVLLVDRLQIPLAPAGVMSAVARSQEVTDG